MGEFQGRGDGHSRSKQGKEVGFQSSRQRNIYGHLLPIDAIEAWVRTVLYKKAMSLL